jgi:hypothetical protein
LVHRWQVVTANWGPLALRLVNGAERYGVYGVYGVSLSGARLQ